MTQELAAGAYTVDPSTPTTTAAAVWTENCQLARVGVGQVEVSLQRPTPLALFAGFAELSTKPTVSITTSVVWTSDCVYTVWTTLANGTAVDAPFYFEFLRKGS